MSEVKAQAKIWEKIVSTNMMFFNVVSKLGKNRKINQPDGSPEIPGNVLQTFLMPRYGLNDETLSEKTGLSKSELSNIFNGKTKITPEVVWKLRPAIH
jgi:antitoxin component HigA of HigAB toxin-antitoxin module